MRIYDIHSGKEKEKEILEKLVKQGEEFYNKYREKKVAKPKGIKLIRFLS